MNITNDKFPRRPRLMFMGTSEFSLPTLRALIDHGHELLAVVTQPDRRKGRGKKMAAPPVKELAVERNIEVFQPEKASDQQFCDIIGQKEPDLIIVVAFGQILKKRLLDIPNWGVINIHPSLLPRYRGAAPMQWAILNDDPLTGLTIMRIDEGMDTGPILHQESLTILKDETFGQMHDRLAIKAGDLMIRFLSHIAGRPIEEVPQDDSAATYASKIEKGHGLIDWNEEAVRISALIRALDPRPGAYTTLGGKGIKLFSSRVVDEGRQGGIPGRVAGERDEGIQVETLKGVVEIRELQYSGRKRLPASDFLRGFPIRGDTILGQ